MRHGSQIDPPNRFETIHTQTDFDQVESDNEFLSDRIDRPIEYLEDDSQSIVSENSSPDIPFRYSLNPYRGCIHGCSYCYARPGHEYLGFSAGLDFETKIIVKRDAARLFRKFLLRKSWNVEPINFSGVTDCYQPAERKFLLTRECLRVALEFCQPISIVTKNALVTRDVEILNGLAKNGLVHVFVSITTLDAQLARDMEPRTSIPTARLSAIKTLADSGVPVGVMVAPVIPGLNDSEIPVILEAAKEAGASAANYVLLRLPLTVESVFREWLHRTRPLQADRVLSRIQDTRGGEMNRSQWGERMVGDGQLAGQINKLFHIFRKQNGLAEKLPGHNCGLFRRPSSNADQGMLF